MVTAREPRASPASPRDFVDRIACWRTSPSSPNDSRAEPAEEPLLARTESGWTRTPADSSLDSSDSDGHTLTRAPFIPKGRQRRDPQHTRRWLVGCFVVILLAGTGWRISTSGSADLARLGSPWSAGHEDFLEPEIHSSRPTTPSGPAPDATEHTIGAPDSYPESNAAVTPTSAHDGASPQSPTSVRISNVHPRPRPPSAASRAGSTIKYLAYENHSGFHNRQCCPSIFSLSGRRADPNSENTIPTLQSANPSSMRLYSLNCSIEPFSSRLRDSVTRCHGSLIPKTLSLSPSDARPVSSSKNPLRRTRTRT